MFAVSAVMSRLVSSEPYTASFITNVVKAVVIFAPSAVLYLVLTKLARIGLFGKNRL